MLRLAVVSSAVLASLSSREVTPSPASQELEQDFVPRILAWSKAGGVFDVANALPRGAYDRVCVIPEYNCLDRQKTLGRINEYHSSFGMCVPENNSALVLIRGDTAHAVLIDRARLGFDVLSGGKCVAAAKAVLRSNPEPAAHPPVVALTQS